MDLPGYTLSTLSAPLIAHFACIITLSSIRQSEVPTRKIAGGSWRRGQNRKTFSDNKQSSNSLSSCLYPRRKARSWDRDVGLRSCLGSKLRCIYDNNSQSKDTKLGWWHLDEGEEKTYKFLHDTDVQHQRLVEVMRLWQEARQIVRPKVEHKTLECKFGPAFQ